MMKNDNISDKLRLLRVRKRMLPSTDSMLERVEIMAIYQSIQLGH